MILQLDNPLLRKRAKPVLKKDMGTPRLRLALQRMKKALSAEESGVAIAAPQIGVSWRIFIIAGRAFEMEKESSPEKTPISQTRVFINPEIVRLSRATHEVSEGCLSVRGIYGIVSRHEKATVRALNEAGEIFTYHGSGLISQIFQHEIDHLEGVLYVDKAERFEKESAQENSSKTPQL